MLSRVVVSQVKHNSWFLAGLALGLWVALAAVPLEDAPACAPPPPPAPDDYEPQREERPDRASIAAGRSIQRPRYYSTELGMRAPLFAGVLAAGAGAGDEAAGARAAAINSTARLLQPALKFFITAGSRQAPGIGLANVVGFTDTREMLKPFHALKYLADNYLEEYDFFFLASDDAYVNARRLTELVARLSVSQHVYMGVPAEDDSHYCSLESGIILSNSVLRAIHNELDWCVRNSYSPRHHENIGRCVLHAAHTPCSTTRQGESYVSARLGSPPALAPALADAVTAGPARTAGDVYSAHAYVARVRLERARGRARALRAAVAAGLRRHPPGFRNATWPGGLRGDPGLRAPAPASRFDLPRWTGLNRTHAFMPDDRAAAAPLDAAHKRALDLVWEAAHAWALRRWGATHAELVEGALRWEPAAALRYRLLLRLHHAADDGRSSVTLRQLEVARPLGAARLVPVPYVTESARLALVLPAPAPAPADTAAFLARYEAVCLLNDRNTNLLIVLLTEEGADASEFEPVRAAAATLASKYRASVEVLQAPAPAPGPPGAEAGAAGPGAQARAALAAALPRLADDALVLLAHTTMEFNEDFLNRARMNSILGAQWFLPLGFARYATFVHPRSASPDGSRPQHHTGHFAGRAAAGDVAAFYKADYAKALAEWSATGGSAWAGVAAVLARGPARCLRAPEPGLVLPPPPPPCAGGTGAGRAACLRALREGGDLGGALALGARHVLAKILLEDRAERER